MVSSLGRKYALIPDVPDERDKIVETKIVPAKPGEVVDLREYFGPIRDQGMLGACTAFSTVAYREFLYNRFYEYEKNKTVPTHQLILSPLYVYYKERQLEDTVNEDNGAQIRSTVTVLNKFGACTESRDLYDVHNYKLAPTAAQDEIAESYKSGAYHRVVGGVEDMKSVLRSGYPIIIGMQVYQSFEDNYTARTGEMLVPDVQHEQCLGGHAIVVCGFDEDKQHFIVRNSWGAGWGDKGYFYMPYKVAEIPNLIMDKWISHLGKAWVPKKKDDKPHEAAPEHKE